MSVPPFHLPMYTSKDIQCPQYCCSLVESQCICSLFVTNFLECVVCPSQDGATCSNYTMSYSLILLRPWSLFISVASPMYLPALPSALDDRFKSPGMLPSIITSSMLSLIMITMFNYVLYLQLLCRFRIENPNIICIYYSL